MPVFHRYQIAKPRAAHLLFAATRELLRVMTICGMLIATFGSLACAAPIATKSGFVEGVTEGSALVYKGIPYAAVPVGDLRWRAPQPAPSWQGVRKADRFAPICPQHGAYPPESPAEAASEDCLYLNIWTPIDSATKKLPVMVWIYGGALENGSASTPLYAGDKLIEHDVIVVTLNYRLGALGFLALPALSRESGYGISGNYGLLDQIAALRWVHDNIAAFGGDPSRVTVFGQSSGAISISALVASPLAKGLFQRAIGESGGLFEPIELSPGYSLAGAEQEGEEFASRNGVAALRDLRRLTVEDVLKMPFDAHLIVDGFALTESPYDAYRHGAQNDVDLLVGTNADEGELFLAGKSITTANFEATLAADFSSAFVWLMHPNPGSSDAEAHRSAARFESDMRFHWDMWTWARLGAASHHGKVFLYRFSRTPPFRGESRYFGLGATHGMEMPYVFGHLDDASAQWQAQDRTLATVLPAYWTHFAATGDPNGVDLPSWPEFDADSPQWMILGDRIEHAPIADLDQLQKIDCVYAGIRFAYMHRYALITAAVILLGGMVLATYLAIRRWRARRSRAA